MLHRSRNVGLLVLLALCSGCGGASNAPPSNSNTAEYAAQSNEEMKKMYGVPKSEGSSGPANASDQMRAMYNK